MSAKVFSKGREFYDIFVCLSVLQKDTQIFKRFIKGTKKAKERV